MVVGETLSAVVVVVLVIVEDVVMEMVVVVVVFFRFVLDRYVLVGMLSLVLPLEMMKGKRQDKSKC